MNLTILYVCVPLLIKIGLRMHKNYFVVFSCRSHKTNACCGGFGQNFTIYEFFHCLFFLVAMDITSTCPKQVPEHWP